MSSGKILIITDNFLLVNRIKKIIEYKIKSDFHFDYGYSPRNQLFDNKYKNEKWIKSINVKNEVDNLNQNYELIISLHCKQIFPIELLNKVRCINIHPGLNPYNRGWFPQAFSIVNGLPCGATIHEMDEKLDHGPIICQKEVKINLWDTSLSVYNRIIDAELELFNEYFYKILENNYETYIPEKGNINSKQDYKSLCEIDLTNVDSFLNHINKLRALTHGEHMNAYFLDENGNEIYLMLELKK